MDLHLISDKWVECNKCGMWLWNCYCSYIPEIIDGTPGMYICPFCFNKK